MILKIRYLSWSHKHDIPNALINTYIINLINFFTMPKIPYAEI